MAQNDIMFDPLGHTYRVKGIVWPSVTQILEPIIQLDRIDPVVLAAAADLGNKVHDACFLDDCGQLDIETTDPVLVPYVTAWRALLKWFDARVILNERIVHHPLLRICGKIDRLLWSHHWNEMLIDLKTASYIPRSVGPQTSAYREFLAEEGFQNVTRRTRRAVAVLHPDGTFKLRDLRNKNDYNCFVSCYNVHRWNTDKVQLE